MITSAKFAASAPAARRTPAIWRTILSSGLFVPAIVTGMLFGSGFSSSASVSANDNSTTAEKGDTDRESVSRISDSGNAEAAAIEYLSGHYLETRTCQVYTGPCFANGETGLTGREAIMAWNIQEGKYLGVDLTGLKVVMAVQGTQTLGHGGLQDAKELRSVIYVDETADARQHQALVDFAKASAAHTSHTVVRISSVPIEMSLNEFKLQGRLDVGRDVQLITRKAGLADCICSNETAFYPPLTKVENFAPGVTTVGEFHGRGLGVSWSTPESRSSFMATFSTQPKVLQASTGK